MEKFMEVKEGGIVIVKGDNIENGGLKIVYGSDASEERKKEPLTEDELKRKVERVLTHIGTTNRLWFSVCKYMMWGRMVSDGDFGTAVSILERLYPHLKLNADDLSSLNVLSFKKEVKDWDPLNAPVKGATFNKYLIIAELMDL